MSAMIRHIDRMRGPAPPKMCYSIMHVVYSVANANRHR